MSTLTEDKYFYITDIRYNKVKLGSSADCMCFHLNSYRILCEYLNKTYTLSNIHPNLKLNNQLINKKLLIWETGNIVSTSDLTLITNEIKQINRIPGKDINKLTNYSNRIGSITRSC